MANELQTFLAQGIVKAAGDLEAAFGRVPEDKRTWSPAASSRSALDQIAECAILNGYTAETIEARAWDPNDKFAGYVKVKEEAVEKGWSYIEPIFKASVERVSTAVRDFPTDSLNNPIETSFGPMTLTQILAYPYWNMCYHEGQINYIATILGTF